MEHGFLMWTMNQIKNAKIPSNNQQDNFFNEVREKRHYWLFESIYVKSCARKLDAHYQSWVLFNLAMSHGKNGPKALFKNPEMEKGHMWADIKMWNLPKQTWKDDNPIKGGAGLKQRVLHQNNWCHQQNSHQLDRETPYCS